MKEKIKNYLEKKEWSFAENKDIFKIDVNGQNISWSSFVKADEDYNFTYFSVLPSKVPEEKITFFVELINKINCAIWFGNFELITEEENLGQVRFRTSSFVPPEANEETVFGLIDAAFNYNMTAMNYYGSSLMKALYSDIKNISDFQVQE